MCLLLCPKNILNLCIKIVPATVHCPKNILKLCIKTEPVTVGADVTVYVWVMDYGEKVWEQMPDIYRCICSIAVTGSVFMQRFGMFLRQCAVSTG